MRQNTLKYTIIFAILVVIGIFAVQSIILKNKLDLNEKQFEESTMIALREVTMEILQYNKAYYGQSADMDNPEPVEKVSNDYYIVNVNDVIDGDVLKYLLIQAFKKHDINTDFEFAVYDCDNDRMEYGAYVSADSDTAREVKSSKLPKSDKYTYYFGVHFPHRSLYFNSRMKGAYVFTILLVIVVLFFGYTLYIIIRQRQLSEIQKNFINNLTHELKTPISSIGLSAKVINNKNILNTPGRLFEYARIIQEQNQRLSNNVEKVLDLAMLEKNKIRLKPEPVVLSDFLTTVIKQFRQSSTGESATIDLTIVSAGLSVMADTFHFTQVLLNILENSVKYCRRQPEINVQLSSNNRWAIVMITDNGIGIPGYARKKIFQKFYRVPTGNVHNVKGFGLGLDYVNKIIKTHQWKIKVEDNPSGGSIFSILIPRKSYGK